MADEKVRLLLSSLAERTQTMYLENWQIWVNYCRARKIAPRMDTSVRNCGREVLSFLTWGHTVMKNGGGAPADRFSAIRFLRLVG